MDRAHSFASEHWALIQRVESNPRSKVFADQLHPVIVVRRKGEIAGILKVQRPSVCVRLQRQRYANKSHQHHECVGGAAGEAGSGNYRQPYCTNRVHHINMLFGKHNPFRVPLPKFSILGCTSIRCSMVDCRQIWLRKSNGSFNSPHERAHVKVQEICLRRIGRSKVTRPQEARLP